MNTKGKGGEKAGGSNPRAKATNWPPEFSPRLVHREVVYASKICFQEEASHSLYNCSKLKYGTTYTMEQVHHHWRWQRILGDLWLSI